MFRPNNVSLETTAANAQIMLRETLFGRGFIISSKRINVGIYERVNISLCTNTVAYYRL
jgi:hypothetical protein